MQSQLFTRYSFDECKNEKKLFEKLSHLQKEDKIEFSKEDQFTFKIKDIELSDSEIEDLLEFFDNQDVFPYLEEIDDLEFDDYNDFHDEDDDYTSKRYRSKDEDYDDY